MYCTVVIHQDVELGGVTIHNTFEDALDHAVAYCVKVETDDVDETVIRHELDNRISYCSPNNDFTIYIGSVTDKRKVAN